MGVGLKDFHLAWFCKGELARVMGIDNCVQCVCVCVRERQADEERA